MSAAAPAVSMRAIDKRFGAVHANQAVDLTVAAGTVHGIVGENGAGKSTLMSILYGFYRADSGTIRHTVEAEVLRRRPLAGRDDVEPHPAAAEAVDGREQPGDMPRRVEGRGAGRDQSEARRVVGEQRQQRDRVALRCVDGVLQVEIAAAADRLRDRQRVLEEEEVEARGIEAAGEVDEVPPFDQSAPSFRESVACQAGGPNLVKYPRWNFLAANRASDRILAGSRP